MYRVTGRGSGGPLGGATSPGGPLGLRGDSSQPLVGLARPLLGPMRLRVGGNPKGGAPPLLGGQAPTPWPPPLGFSLEGRPPLPFPLYIEG